MLGTLVLDVGYTPQLILLLMTVSSRKWYILKVGVGCHGPSQRPKAKVMVMAMADGGGECVM